MNQIAAILAPAALPNTAGALVHAETAAAQGANFAGLLAQFREALLNQFAGGETAPDVIPGQPAPSLDVVHATPPAEALSPLDVLALPPSKPRTSPDTVSEGGAAIIPPHLALLQFVFPAAQAQPPAETPAPAVQVQLLAETAAPAAQAQPPAKTPAPPAPPNANAIDTLSLRGALLPEQAIAAAAQVAMPKPARPASVIADTQAEPAPSSYKASETAVEHAAAQVALLTGVPKLKPAGAPQSPSAPPGHQDMAAASTSAQPPAAVPTLKSADAPQPPSAPPSNQDTAVASTSAQPFAAVPTPALPAPVGAQAFTAAVAAAPQAGVTIDTLAVHVARKFQQGSSQFEIRLQPMELGRLDISLTVAEDGRVQAVLRIERPETLDMLQRDARLLEQQLRQAGLEVGSNALSFSLSNGNGQRPAPFPAWPAFADAQNATGAAKDEATSTYIAVRTRDGVDIRV